MRELPELGAQEKSSASTVAPSPASRTAGAPLLTGIHGLRASSAPVAEAVVRAAVADQVAAFNPTNPTQAATRCGDRPTQTSAEPGRRG